MSAALAEVLSEIVIVVVGIVLLKAFAWWRAHASVAGDKAYSHAVEALETGVHEAWLKFGKLYKAARKDGKMSVEEKDELRAFAKAAAVEIGKEQGLDVVKIIGKRAIPLLISKIVKSRKTDV